MIFDITLSEMGYEFTAVCKKGAIFSDVGMLLSSVTEGGIPFDDWAQGKQSKYEGIYNVGAESNALEFRWVRSTSALF